jgi:hypothetical protein
MGYVNPAFTGGSGGGISPSDNITITGIWQASDPTTAQQLATRNYVDTHNTPNPNNVIAAWSNATAYTVGSFAYTGNAIWCCKVANTNSAPSLTNNNWVREADTDTSTLKLFTQNINANYTWSKGIFSVRAAALAADITVTLSAISTFVDSGTSNRIQEFILVKADNSHNIVLNTTSPDTFSDGTTTRTISGNTVFRMILDFTSSIWRIT